MPEQKIPVAELVKHATTDNCWILVNGKVYDLTQFAPKHPGGPDMIYRYAGKDGSKTYNEYHGEDLIEKTLSAEEKKGDFDESTITETWIKAQQEQIESHSAPNEKPPLSAIINLSDFEEAFKKAASEKANAYTAGASNDLLTLNANKSYWQKLWFRPRVMRDVASVDTSMTMLGVNATMPVWICPMGMGKTAGPEAETALAAGAKATKIIQCASSSASISIEDMVAAGQGNPMFFQLYVDKDRKKTEQRLHALDKMPEIKAIFVTADLAVVSKREADERLQSKEIIRRYGANEELKVDKKGAGIARAAGSYIDPSLSWKDVAWIKEHTALPILVKGIQSAADAKTALELGCAGIVVSNHGGRALDNAPATILVLLELRRDCPEVFDCMEVLIDGGVRRGSDILKAVMLGARGVGVGRPFQCAIAYGSEGVKHCANIIQDELETAMRLCGVTDLASVRGDTSYLNMVELETLLPAKPNAGSFLSRWFKARL